MSAAAAAPRPLLARLAALPVRLVGPELLRRIDEETKDHASETRRATCAKRLQKELRDSQRLESENLSLGPVSDDLYLWCATFMGPKGTPYEGGVFFMDIRSPEDYPFKPPACRLTTKIYHCNWTDRGTVPRSPRPRSARRRVRLLSGSDRGPQFGLACRCVVFGH
jgi:hypothetical protein